MVQDAKNKQWERIVSLTNVLEKLDNHTQKSEMKTLPYILHKIQFKTD